MLRRKCNMNGIDMPQAAIDLCCLIRLPDEPFIHPRIEGRSVTHGMCAHVMRGFSYVVHAYVYTYRKDPKIPLTNTNVAQASTRIRAEYRDQRIPFDTSRPDQILKPSS